MDWHNLMSTLATQATDLELLQLQTAVEHLLMQPSRMIAIRQQLHVGQTVQYLDVRDNRMHAAKVIEFKPDQLMVHASHDAKYKWIRYAAVALDPSAKAAQSQPKEVLPRREDFVVGDTVSFEGRDLIRKFGKISRINQKTASIVCEDGHEWRVSFALLQRVMNV
ncbi:MAG: hypothetical protein PHS32_10440 [Rhodoferax sp.]|uniref:hypothetical protein n=1 Tax=Rhodoferax sp. TaxID=50421 RepID=UPI0026246C5F|nr:hypothetical protein [Rhodoferax sp.]MDD5334155.1 hypothetical protein [Rhodoferax sp.]